MNRSPIRRLLLSFQIRIYYHTLQSSKKYPLSYAITNFPLLSFIRLNCGLIGAIFCNKILMKSQLKKRPQSTKIRAQSSNGNRRANAVLGEDYFKKGKAEQLAGNHPKAIEFYTLAATCKPSYFQAYCNMGYCYRVLGKFGQAKRSYQSALYSNPQDPISHFNLANLYRVMGENEMAIEEYSHVIALKQQGANVGNLYLDSLVNIGICYKNKGAIDQAIRVNRKVLEIDPNQGSALFNLAVCLLNSIQDKNTPYFLKVYHERATEAQAHFQNILKKDPDSIMAQFSLIKISTILNPNLKNVQVALEKLKDLLNKPRCDIKDEISQEIARCLNLLKKFDESARFYEDSVGSITRRASQSKKTDNNKIDNIFQPFSQGNIGENEFLTEASGIALIESGNFQAADKKISQLPDGLLKQTLHLILELRIAQEDSDNINNAIKAYNLYFNKSQAELPFEKLSIQAHKAIGKVLSLQQKYEQSIKHYEYVSQRIKNNRTSESAKLHSELGERFQEVGNRQKALEEYKKGIEIEPDNYSLSYSMGYCLFENGNYEEAKACFQRIIQRVRKDTSLSAQTKELYETDCMINCALSSTEHSATTFDLFTNAYKKLQRLQQSEESELQMEDENLLLFFIRISELYEQKVSPLFPEDPQYRGLAEMLIAIYSSLLELTCCPDRNEVLTNSGILSYQLGHYATAAATYSQISSPQHLPNLNLAMAYAHLIEPTLALKYVQQACQMQPNDHINLFCREVLEWIYMGSNSGEWNKHLPAYKQDLFYERTEYGVGLLDKLSETINSPDYQPKTQDKLLESLAKHQQKIKSRHPIITHKFQSLQALEKKYDFFAPPPRKGILSPQILKLCFSKSNNTLADFSKLIQLLQSMPKCGQQSYFCEAAIFLFIYYNQVQSLAIQEALAKMVHRKKQEVNIESPSTSQKRPEIYSIYPDFKNVKEAIAVLKEWEQVLQSATREVLSILEDVYYRGNVRQPFEAQYHFPRHTNLLEEDQTFEKFISIVLNVIKYNKKLICRGNNVKELRTDLIKDFQIQFARYLKETTLQPITLSNNFLPVTLYAVHQTKKDCQDFISEVTKRLKVPQVTISDCDQFILVVNKVVRVRCRWHNPYEISSVVAEVADNIIQNPLFIANQAIIYLENFIQSIKNDSPEAAKYVSHDATLNF